MLRHLSLREARETFKRLLPDTRPKAYIYSGASSIYGFRSSSGSQSRTYGPHDDWLEKVEAIGPEGEDLDPWFGVEPTVVDLRSPEERLAEAAA